MPHTVLMIGFVVFAAAVAVILAWLVVGRRQSAPILRVGVLDPPPAPHRESILLEPALNATVAGLATVAQRGGTGLEMGIPADLGVHLDSAILHEAMREVLFAALRAAPGGTIRIAGVRRGRRLDLTISDDGPVLDELARRVSLAGAASLLAPHGIAVLVQPRLGMGTTVTLRIPGHLVCDRPARAARVQDSPALVPTAC